ncbi:MAG: hypothetical protein ACTSYB_12445 [Candidatus Helarchaeota archaeon]
MSANKVIGGLLALIGGFMVLLPLLIHPIVGIQTAISLLSVSFQYFLPWLVIFLISVLALVGGILAMAGKKAGGILALIMGLIIIIFLILPYIIPDLYLITFMAYASGTWELYVAGSIGFSFVATIYVSLESILILVGGIIAIPGE